MAHDHVRTTSKTTSAPKSKTTTTSAPKSKTTPTLGDGPTYISTTTSAPKSKTAPTLGYGPTYISTTTSAPTSKTTSAPKSKTTPPQGRKSQEGTKQRRLRLGLANGEGLLRILRTVCGRAARGMERPALRLCAQPC